MEFSEVEFETIQNHSFFKVKAAVIEKVEQQFALIAKEMEGLYSQFSPSIPYAPNEVFSKISRGENLQQLPFLILDLPKHFTKEEVFSFRLLFWWGKGFTLFLHLKNNDLQSILEKSLKHSSQLVEMNTKLSTFGDEWNHDVDSENYQTLTNFNSSQDIDFVKFAWFLPFSDATELKEFTNHRMKQILSIISHHE